MSGTMASLPPGFVLDKPETPAQGPALPPGFVLDPPQEPRSWGGVAMDVAQQFARGGTLGFGDEIAAGIGATVAPLTGASGTWQQRYDRLLDDNRQRQKRFEAEHPWTAFGAQVAGAVANPVSRLSAGSNFLTRAGSNALINGLLGGVTGFGEGEGGFVNRLGPAGTGAATGAVLGAALPAAAEGVAAGFRKVAPSLGVNVAATDAKRGVIDALKAGGVDLAQARTQLDAATGQPMALVDVGGEALMGRAQTASRTPGAAMQAAKEFVDTRGGLNQSARVEGEIKRAINAQDFLGAKNDITRARAVAAQPLYEQAFTKVVPTAEQAANVQRFIKDPIGQEALQKGLRIIELEHLAAGTKFDPRAYGVVREGAAPPPRSGPSPGFSPGSPSAAGGGPRADALSTPPPTPGGPSPSGKWVLEPNKVPTLRLMDAVKRGYDDIVEGFRNEYGVLKLDQYGRAVNNARAVYTGSLRDMFPEYGAALNAWAGPSRALDAMNLGKRVLSGDADETSQVIAKLSDSEKDMFRIGVARALIDKVKSTNDTADITAVNKIWGSQAVRERVAAAFDDPKEFERFAAFMDNELKMARTNAEVNPRGNSITAKLLMQNAEPAPVGPVLQGARAALRGDPLGFVASMMPNKPQPGSLNAQTAAEMAPYLFSLKPGDRARLIDALIAQEGRDTKVKRIVDPVANALMRGATVGAVQLEN